MPSKPTQDVWCELWEDARSRGLHIWYIVKGIDSMRNSDHPVGTGWDEDESDAGSGWFGSAFAER